ncbi:hypothetical protein Afil01_57800 [Actinorhabdospora filicis]|uniref:DM13 domain-containing protein n=1 Tax=Actinorhabdospora filicis TaxID=1785913 RepID=A0A9W6SRE8_9ACTN|nr:DM13 domain-containing protein [Actinorhabdospora filicis]GLZ80973.1 hypothetical protein Afil01_57800 [Actinorhabdospora filicis]
MLRRLARKPLTWVIIAVLIAGAGFGLYWFQPWRLWTASTAHDALPVVTASDSATPGPVLLASGTFVAHEHETTGTVQLVRQPDGGVVLAIAGLATSDGPDVHVWLTDQAVTADGWKVFDDGYHREIGKLRANNGDQVYDVPADVDLAKVTSVSIWCERFSVSFGAATLA